MNEREFAVILANKVLERVSADPDDDLAILARQFLRAREQLQWYGECASHSLKKTGRRNQIMHLLL